MTCIRTPLLLAALILFCQMLPSTEAKAADHLQIPVTGEAKRFLHGLELATNDNFPAADDTQVFIRSSDLVTVQLGLGETMNKVVILRPHEETTEFKVEQSFETSLTLMDEGPHMDLLDWQHYHAEWVELQCETETTFLARDINSDRFPEVTTAEIVSAVRTESQKWTNDGYDPGERWIRLAGACKTPNTYPCGVSVSKAFLRVMARVAGQWQQLLLIEFIVPMGC